MPAPSPAAHLSMGPGTSLRIVQASLTTLATRDPSATTRACRCKTFGTQPKHRTTGTPRPSSGCRGSLRCRSKASSSVPCSASPPQSRRPTQCSRCDCVCVCTFDAGAGVVPRLCHGGSLVLRKFLVLLGSCTVLPMPRVTGATLHVCPPVTLVDARTLLKSCLVRVCMPSCV
jgi:hypothetical protein